MGLIKAILKLIGKSASDKMCENEKRNAPKKAYAETGKEMHKANKHGRTLNGSKTYRVKKYEIIKKADTKNENRKNFINDFFD